MPKDGVMVWDEDDKRVVATAQYGRAYLRRLWGLDKVPLDATVDLKTGEITK
jgi:hypothetical protein